VDLAFEFARENKAPIEAWLASRHVHCVTDDGT
jgi:hypothetical protein